GGGVEREDDSLFHVQHALEGDAQRRGVDDADVGAGEGNQTAGTQSTAVEDIGAAGLLNGQIIPFDIDLARPVAVDHHVPDPRGAYPAMVLQPYADSRARRGGGDTIDGYISQAGCLDRTLNDVHPVVVSAGACAEAGHGDLPVHRDDLGGGTAGVADHAH